MVGFGVDPSRALIGFGKDTVDLIPDPCDGIGGRRNRLSGAVDGGGVRHEWERVDPLVSVCPKIIMSGMARLVILV